MLTEIEMEFDPLSSSSAHLHRTAIAKREKKTQIDAKMVWIQTKS